MYSDIHQSYFCVMSVLGVSYTFDGDVSATKIRDNRERCTVRREVKSSYITTDGQPANLSWCQAPTSDPRPIFLSFFNYFYTVKDLVM
jgi:hypothetical protein